MTEPFQTLATKPSFASLGFCAAFISAITSSILKRATDSPSNKWALSFALLSSKIERRVTISLLCAINALKIDFRFINFGIPLSIATMLIPKTVCISVSLYKLFSITSGTSPRLSSTTIRIPSLSDSSLRPVIPSIFLSLTSSAILVMSLALFT